MDSLGSDILFERRGAAGIVTLNRPKALNAVTHDMVWALARQLDAWADDAANVRAKYGTDDKIVGANEDSRNTNVQSVTRAATASGFAPRAPWCPDYADGKR